MALFSSGIFAVLNPAGFVASKIQDKQGGDAQQRVSTYIKTNAPLGCNGSLVGCSFEGTQADFQEYRRDWIQQCTSANATNFTQSTNRTNGQCQAQFDEATKSIRFTNFQKNAEEKNYIMSKLGQDSPLVYLIIFLFVALIIYLLMSKK